jgi:hypothetical protein
MKTKNQSMKTIISGALAATVVAVWLNLYLLFYQTDQLQQ